MKYRNVSIASLGWAMPPKAVTSAAIEDRLAPLYDRIGLVPGRLELMTGIRERRWWDEPIRPSDIATIAGAHALSRTGFDRARIGCLVHASVCRDFLEPATANVVHERLGLRPECQVLDVSNACLGVMSGMLLVANMIELGQIDAGLIVAGEDGRPLVDATIQRLVSDPTVTRKSIKGSFASLTIGSGGVAVLLTRSDLSGGTGHPILGATIRAATEHNRLCQGGASNGIGDTGLAGGGGLDMSTDAEALLEAGIELAKRNYSALLEELAWSADHPARVVTHQVGRAHQKALFDVLGLPFDKGFVTFDTLGNVGSVSLPISLALAAEQGFVAPGHDVALLGIGSGLSSVMMGVRW
ncbi:3-oxoacyl-ACP synthase III [Myxococcota bacterium]|nr:3-oxoacyl-ACP synthase III [Myxococcota bacterium]